MKEPRCCFIPCEAPAEWTIASGPTPDDYTEACTAHVGALLTDADEQRIYPFSRDPSLLSAPEEARA